MKFFFFFFSPLLLWSTVNEPFRSFFFSGYRNDRIHWHLQNPGNDATLTYTELYRNVQFWENGVAFKAVQRDLSFFLTASYGAFGRGDVFQKYHNLAPFEQSPSFQYESEGWCADASGYFGYAVDLTPDRTYKVVLTPLIGYSGHFEHLKRRGEPSSSIESFSGALPGVFKLVWNGFLFGAVFQAEPGGGLKFQGGYSYHLMHNQLDTSIRYQSGDSSVRQSVKTSSKGNSGQTGWASFDWLLNRYWSLGLGAQLHYFSTRVVDASIEQTGRGDFSQKLKLRWTPISGWVQISRSL